MCTPFGMNFVASVFTKKNADRLDQSLRFLRSVVSCCRLLGSFASPSVIVPETGTLDAMEMKAIATEADEEPSHFLTCAVSMVQAVRLRLDAPPPAPLDFGVRIIPVAFWRYSSVRVSLVVAVIAPPPRLGFGRRNKDTFGAHRRSVGLPEGCRNSVALLVRV